MNKIYITLLLFLMFFTSCKELLEPEPENVLSNDLVLSTADDIENVRIGLYNAFRGIASPKVIVGDFTADMVSHRGTFTEYQELGNKQITSSNAVATALWGAVYRTVYISNFILERLPALTGVPSRTRNELLATARFLRGYALFVGVNTFGGIPLPTTTDVETNKNVPRASREEVINFVLEDYLFALENIEDEPVNAAFAGLNAVRAALAQFYLYQGNWAEAENYASQVIASEEYTLVEYEEIVLTDFPEESILEVGYSVADDPGTGATSLNNLFKGRREIVPTNKIVNLLYSAESGERNQTVAFDIKNFAGNDNGWSVAKYGTSDDDNNNIVVFRLAEMYLIRAEARAQLGKINGAGSAEEDINALRTRANAPTVSVFSQPQMLTIIEQERVYELAYEGHRWYDLVRTGRANTVMSAFTPNWKENYNLWPIPLRELQNNSSLTNNQNPGY